MLKNDQSYQNNRPTLFIVSTPIGNLGDITYRAVETLKRVEVIFAEDTRVSKTLLNYYQIEKKLQSFQGYLEESKAPLVIKYLADGFDVALISDAGTPLISDPGYLLVQEVLKHDYNVVAIPGPSALLTSLVSSGLKPMPFTFLGFLPRKVSDIKKVLSNYQNQATTLIIYEAPSRVSGTLKALFELFGNQRVCLARELTKKFETIIRGSLIEVLDLTLDHRGEYVIMIEITPQDKPIELTIKEMVRHYIELGFDEKEAIKKTAKDFQVHKSIIYKDYKIDN